MLAVRFETCGPPADVLNAQDVARPEPTRGQVRIRMLASPVNPSDLMFVQGAYGQRPPLPATPGFEGVGIVESSGGGLLGRLLTGKRVAVLNPTGGNWAAEVVVPAKRVVPLPKSLTLQQAATFFVNPASAVAMTERILRVQPCEWLLQSAAASSLGRMIVRLGRERGFRTLNIVRRAEQVEELKSLGADDVLVFDAARDDADALVQQVRRKTGSVRCAIDPVGGIVGSALAECLRDGGQLLVYGSLSGLAIHLAPRTLIATRARIEGFWLGPWMLAQSLPSKLRLIRRVTHLIQRGVLTTHVRAEFPLAEIRAAVTAAAQPGQTGKVLLHIGPQNG